MISKKMANALTKQVNAELYSAYLYMAMSSYASSENLKGTAMWLVMQAKEESSHAQKIYEYLNSQGEHVIFDAVEKPPAQYKSLNDIFEKVLAHEKKVTGLINKLVNMAKAEKDNATEIFLQWFVTEQVEEEENASEILATLAMAGKSPQVLFMIDRQLGARQQA